jgi:hypothetical protein
MKHSGTIGIALFAVLMLVPIAAARQAASSSGKVGVSIDFKVEDTAYAFNGPASCFYMPKANIMSVSGEHWQVAQQAPERSVVLSFLKPADGGEDMFSLHVTTGGKKYVTNTIVFRRGAAKPPTEGSGSAKFEPAGKGGTFTVDATAVNGAKVTGTIKCDGFTARREVGGE